MAFGGLEELMFLFLFSCPLLSVDEAERVEERNLDL
jgi:hypothetical protein